MNVFSLFSGIGGLELGLERAGMTVVAQVEIDPYCRRVLAKHWPEVPRHDDVRTCIDWWTGTTPPVADTERSRRLGADDDQREHHQAGRSQRFTPTHHGFTGEGSSESRLGFDGVPAATGRPTVDLVCGGFPCQPVSVAGQRLAQADPRWLWPAFHSVVRALRPRYVLVENVPGLLAAGMGDVLGDLAGLGYDAEWDRVPAAFVGAPHIRGRIFIVAYPNSCAGDARRGRQGTAQTSDLRPGRRGQLANGSAELADTTIPERRTPQQQRLETARWGTAEPRERGSSSRPGGDWWAVEPDVGRVAHGIPARLDRLRALGNAVVPQVAEHIGRLILQADREAAA